MFWDHPTSHSNINYWVSRIISLKWRILKVFRWLWSIVWGFAIYKRNSGPGKHLPRVGRAESVGDVIPKTADSKSKSKSKSKSSEKDKNSSKKSEKTPLLAKDKKFFDLPV